MYAASLQYMLYTISNAHIMKGALAFEGLVYYINNDNRRAPLEPPHTPVYIHWSIGN